MTEQEWLACNDPKPMLAFLKGKVSNRKLRFYNFACCRRIWDMIPDQRLRDAIAISESHADGAVGEPEFRQAMKNAHLAVGKHNDLTRAAYDAARYSGGPMSWVDEQVSRAVASVHVPNRPATHKTYFVGEELVHETCPVTAAHIAWDSACKSEKSSQSDLLRDIFGNPFRLVTLDPAWLTPAVLALAQRIYDDRAFDGLPILGDALEEAGCNNAEVLAHCRGSGPHVRGCWVVDAVLGRA